MKVPYCRKVPLVLRRFSDLDVRLRQPRHPVHPVGQVQAVPMDRGA